MSVAHRSLRVVGLTSKRWNRFAVVATAGDCGGMRILGPCREAVLLRSNAATTPFQSLIQQRSLSTATTSLHDLLKREYDEEIENETATMPPELKDLKESLEKKDWKIVEDGATTRLFKTLDGSKVQVSFHCQDNVADDGHQEDAEGEEEIEESSDPVRFLVTITKAGTTLVTTCLSENAAATISSVAVTATDVDKIQANSGGLVDVNEYQGPEFVELAADLQEAFHTYLEEDVGINEDMASFIAMYTDYNEQKQYVKFLEDAKAILK